MLVLQKRGKIMVATKTSNRFVLVEALATALYVYFAGAVVCATGNASFDVLLPVRVVAIALGHGAAYGIMVHWTLLVERSEGVGFLNPAVTLALASACRRFTESHSRTLLAGRAEPATPFHR